MKREEELELGSYQAYPSKVEYSSVGDCLADYNAEQRRITMIQEAYVSFEVAKLLKEKGFNWRTQYVYTLDGTGSTPPKMGNWRAKSNIQKPTQQMAMKWLRETHDIVISIFPTIETDMIVHEDYNYAIYKNKIVVYQSCSTSYENAVEAALKYCLEKIIK